MFIGHGTLNGPNWIQDFSTGEWTVSCVANATNPRRTGTLRALSVPIGSVPDQSALYSIRNGVKLPSMPREPLPPSIPG